MAIETLGEACSQGWRVTVRCAYGRSEGPRSQSSRECNYRKELDMETLVWTRGRAFPLARLENHLRCPCVNDVGSSQDGLSSRETHQAAPRAWLARPRLRRRSSTSPNKRR
jgi:hypothetical protein